MSKLYISDNDLKELHCLIDREIKSIQTVCQKGCSTCCYQSIPVFTFEKIHLKNAILKLEKPTQQIIKKQYLKAIEHFESYLENKELHTVHDILFSGYPQAVSHDKIACPLLIDKMCSIYEDRPLVCRGHVQTDSVELCHTNPMRSPDTISYQIGYNVMNMALESGDAHETLLLIFLKELLDRKRSMKPIKNRLYESKK